MGKLKSLVSVAQLILCRIPSIGLFPPPNPMFPCSVSRCLSSNVLTHTKTLEPSLSWSPSWH